MESNEAPNNADPNDPLAGDAKEFLARVLRHYWAIVAGLFLDSVAFLGLFFESVPNVPVGLLTSIGILVASFLAYRNMRSGLAAQVKKLESDCERIAAEGNNRLQSSKVEWEEQYKGKEADWNDRYGRLADDAARLSEDKRRLEEANQDLRGTIGELRAKLDDRQQRQRQRNELNEIMKFGNQQISELKRRQHGKLAYVESVDANLVREWRQIAEAWLGRERPDFLGTFNSTNDMSLGVMPGNAIRAGIIQHFEHRIGRLNQLYAELAPS